LNIPKDKNAKNIDNIINNKIKRKSELMDYNSDDNDDDKKNQNLKNIK
jgi:hypothetical protein